MRIKNRKEILGHLLRPRFGRVKHFVGRVSVGTPGGWNVPPIQSFPIDEKYKRYFGMQALNEVE